MTSYAANTKVPIEKSRSEVQKLLRDRGATRTVFADDELHGQSVIQFEAKGRVVKFVLNMPKYSSKEFQTDSRGRGRSGSASAKLWETACRQRWRALLLCLKGKFEAIDGGISVFDNEFLAHIVVDGGSTVGDCVIPRLDAIRSGEVSSGQVAGLIGFNNSK